MPVHVHVSTSRRPRAGRHRHHGAAPALRGHGSRLRPWSGQDVSPTSTSSSTPTCTPTCGEPPVRRHADYSSGGNSTTRATRTTTRSASGWTRPECATCPSTASWNCFPGSGSSRHRVTHPARRWWSSRPGAPGRHRRGRGGVGRRARPAGTEGQLMILGLDPRWSGCRTRTSHGAPARLTAPGPPNVFRPAPLPRPALTPGDPDAPDRRSNRHGPDLPRSAAGTMREPYERNGVHVDQCTECRGIPLAPRPAVDATPRTPGAGRGGRRPRTDRRPGRPATAAAGSPPRGRGGGDLGAVVGEVLRQVRGRPGPLTRPPAGCGSRRKKESFLGDLFG